MIVLALYFFSVVGTSLCSLYSKWRALDGVNSIIVSELYVALYSLVSCCQVLEVLNILASKISLKYIILLRLLKDCSELIALL